MSDTSVFPDPTYKSTVLAPLFEGSKAHFAPSVRAINQAHLLMLRDTGILGVEGATAIANALLDIDKTVDLAALEFTGEYEDYFFLVEAELKARLGPDLAGALHTARSRNDMDHTVFKMVLRGRTHALLTQAHALADALITKAEAEKATLIIAYTHGQPAQPSTYGHYLAAMIEVLLRDIARLHAASDALQLCPMGAAAITTSGFPIDRQQMARLLGFEAPLQNSYGCIASIDYVTGLYSAIKLMFLHLGRVVQDLQFWSSFEVGQLYVPNNLVQISSIMPQKRNPVPIEHLRLLASLTIGRCDTIVNTMHNTPFTDMNDSEGEVQQAGYAAFDSGARVLALLTAFIPATSIKAENVQRNTDASCITVTELADTLVRLEGLSFRQAHEISAITAQSVIASGQPLVAGYADFSAAFQAETGRATSLGLAAFETAVSAQNFVDQRDIYGGPAAAPMAAALEGYAGELAGFQARLAAKAAHSKAADTTRLAAFQRLAGKTGAA